LTLSASFAELSMMCKNNSVTETIPHVSFFIKGHIMNNNNRQFVKEKKIFQFKNGTKQKLIWLLFAFCQN